MTTKNDPNQPVANPETPTGTGDVRHSYITGATFGLRKVTYSAIDGLAVFEGDIILGTVEQMEQIRQEIENPDRTVERAVAITGARFRWPDGVIPFQINAAMPDQQRVTDAINHLETNTNLRLPARTSESNFVVFQGGSGCSSPVGMQGNGAQTITLGSGCDWPRAVHEICHSAGLWHEQSREDRDSFVTIHLDNIPANRQHNFNQHISDGDDIAAYDYDSLMHYGRRDFAIDPTKDTITPTPDPSRAIGQRTGLSARDIAAINLLYPITIRRHGDSGDQAGFVSEIAPIKHRTQQVVTATRTQSNTLKLISWQVNANGSVTRTGDSGSQAGIASHIDIAKGNKYVTACRTEAGDLKLISWEINNAGAITRAGDGGSQAGTASLIKIVALSDTLFVTACQTAGGTLKLISWQLNNNGSLTRRNDSGNAAGAVSEVSLAVLSTSGGGGHVVTSVRDGGGNLKLITWNITAAGVVARLGDSGNQAGAATMVRSVRDADGRVVTAVRAGNNSLKLISWSISANGSTVSRLADSGSQAGFIGGNALMNRPNGVLSAVRTQAGTLKLMAWAVTAGAITRTGDSGSQAGIASLMSLCQDALSGDAPIVTAVRTEGNNLKLITWKD